MTRDSGHFSPDSEPALSELKDIKFPLTRPHRLRSQIFLRECMICIRNQRSCTQTPAERSHESFIHGRITGSRKFYFFLVLMFRRRCWFRPYLFIFIIILCVVLPPLKRSEQRRFFLFAVVHGTAHPAKQTAVTVTSSIPASKGAMTSSIPDETLRGATAVMSKAKFGN